MTSGGQDNELGLRPSSPTTGDDFRFGWETSTRCFNKNKNLGIFDLNPLFNSKQEPRYKEDATNGGGNPWKILINYSRTEIGSAFHALVLVMSSSATSWVSCLLLWRRTWEDKVGVIITSVVKDHRFKEPNLCTIAESTAEPPMMSSSSKIDGSLGVL
ncbi:hypothetical protein TIFTF001_030768 [Ficus carica]|uniref:Uncharacterized protein n=1 Tax=Ficus carica TaxID=3494 RepID=A0AA88DV20_FICCA|nr:hypothetical protein TIFTF001_030768 [Ficus carica]